MADTVDSDRPVVINFNARVGNLQANKLMYLANGLQKNGITQAQLHISSGGGLTTKGIVLHNLLKSLPIEFTTHNVGVVDSAANSIYLAGNHRYVCPNASFLIHGVKIDFGKTRPGLSSLESTAKEVRAEQEAIAITIAGSTNLTKSAVLKMMLGDTIINPKQAVAYGMAKKIKRVTVPKGAQIFTICDPPDNSNEQQYLNDF